MPWPRVKKYNIPYKLAAPEGKPGRRICELADDRNIDLIILGSPDRRPTIAKGLPDLDKVLGESLSDYVRVYTPLPGIADPHGGDNGGETSFKSTFCLVRVDQCTKSKAGETIDVPQPRQKRRS